MTDEIVLPAGGLPFLMNWMMSTNGGAPDLQLMLFSNALDPECDVVFGDLVECTFAGYSRFTLNRSNWQTPTVVGCCGIMLYGSAPLSWTNTGSAEQIAGYAMLIGPSGPLIAVQALSVPFDLVSLATLPMRPQITLTTGACPSS